MTRRLPKKGGPASGTEPSGTRGIRFPQPTAEDVEALRAARLRSMATEDVWKALEELEGPTIEELRRRKVTCGEPFRWGTD